MTTKTAPTSEIETMGERLERIRRRTGLSALAAGKALGMGRHRIRFVERDMASPTTDELVKAAILYKVDFDFLIAPAREMAS
jgi:transcriptional regulator with XRE-family HTH domain